MTSLVFTTETTDAGARTGTLETPHGAVQTPAFMPVGTRGTVKALDSADLSSVGAQMVLANTYHLMLRPGAETVDALGGLHEMMNWAGPILTDSGGYQVFSLDPDVDENGASFASVYDGSRHLLTPEEAIRVQELLGADVAMVLDVLVGLPAPRKVIESAMQRTLRWSERARAAHARPDQALFGIVQGGSDPELREQSAKATADLDFDGHGIGGLSVGESAVDRSAALEACIPHLPANKIRYVMGLGDTEGVLDAVGHGADLFDCVWPTRMARHGKVFTSQGDYNLKRVEFATSRAPLEDGCPCHTCGGYSQGTLRHLLRVKEMTAFRLLSIHNLRYTLGVLSDARGAIADGRFEQFRREVVGRRGSTRSVVDGSTITDPRKGNS